MKYYKFYLAYLQTSSISEPTNIFLDWDMTFMKKFLFTLAISDNILIPKRGMQHTSITTNEKADIATSRVQDTFNDIIFNDR